MAAPTALQAARFLAFVAGDAEPPVDGETAAASVRLADEHPGRAPGRRMSTLVVVQARIGLHPAPGQGADAGRGSADAGVHARPPGVGAVDHLVVATCTDAGDDPVAEVAAAAGVSVVRGSESDVLARFVAALDAHPADVVVRLTADCPLIDPAVVNEAVAVRAAPGPTTPPTPSSAPTPTGSTSRS